MSIAEALDSGQAPAPAPVVETDQGTAFGCPREFHGHRFVYTVISSRARGLSLGINMNPDRKCNFDCLYCEVDRTLPTSETGLDTKVMAEELEEMLERIASGRIRDCPAYRGIAEELLRLRHVALSGDGEPTQCPNFAEAVETAVYVRARRPAPFFKLVLITNASGLDRPDVQESLRLFRPQDEVWAKLDGGTDASLARINKPDCSLARILENILNLARQRPVIIQSLFPLVHGTEPAPSEIDAYAQRLKELQTAGARIPLVQIYSASRPTPHAECGHLPLRTLSNIAARVRQLTGLRAEVF